MNGRLPWITGALALLLSACGASPSGPAATGAAGPPVKLTVSYSNVIASNLPEWFAREAGIFQKNGLEVDLELIEGGSRGVAALLAGQTQLAHLGGSEVLSAAAQGGDLVVLATLTPVYPYLFYVPASVRDINDLKGKRVGVVTVGGSYDIATRVALSQLGLVPDKDVTVIPTGSVSSVTAALLSGAIQGGMSQPPDSLVLEARGFRPLFDLAKLQLPSANTTITTMRAYLVSHRDVIQRYVDSIVEAIARARKDKPAAVTVMKKYFKSEDGPAMSATYDYYVGKVIPALPYARPDQFTDAAAQLGKKNEKVRTFDVSRLLDDSFVKSAESRGLAKK